MQLFPPFTAPMPTASQPEVKRMRLDDRQVRTEGTVMVLVRWYVLLVYVEIACVAHFTVYMLGSTHIS